VPIGLLVGAERDSSCWLINGFEADREFFICSSVFLASGLLTGEGLPVIGPSPFLCINSLCKVELRVGPAFDWVGVFGGGNGFAMGDPKRKFGGLVVDRRDDETTVADIGAVEGIRVFD
jgi:hypothetical protein